MPRALSGEAVPNNYRYYFFDADNHVVTTGLLVCTTDADAQAHADRMLGASDHTGIEVWDGPWKVYRARKTGGSIVSEPTGY